MISTSPLPSPPPLPLSLLFLGIQLQKQDDRRQLFMLIKNQGLKFPHRAPRPPPPPPPPRSLNQPALDGAGAGRRAQGHFHPPGRPSIGRNVRPSNAIQFNQMSKRRGRREGLGPDERHHACLVQVNDNVMMMM